VLEVSSGGTDQTQVVDMARVAYKEGIDHIIEVPNYVICHIRRAEQQKKNFNTWDICNAECSNVGSNLCDPTKRYFSGLIHFLFSSIVSMIFLKSLSK